MAEGEMMEVLCTMARADAIVLFGGVDTPLGGCGGGGPRCKACLPQIRGN